MRTYSPFFFLLLLLDLACAVRPDDRYCRNVTRKPPFVSCCRGGGGGGAMTSFSQLTSNKVAAGLERRAFLLASGAAQSGRSDPADQIKNQMQQITLNATEPHAAATRRLLCSSVNAIKSTSCSGYD